jgi:cytochrome c-type biogenesis protein CcmH/NrfG
MCRAVLNSQPHNIDALNFLAAALLAQGELDAGKDCLRRVIGLTPESAETHANPPRRSPAATSTAPSIITGAR